MNEKSRSELLESYVNAYQNIKNVLKDIPSAAYRWRPAPGKWSIHENLLHLADSEANSYIRCRRFIAEPGSGVYGYDQDEWAKKLDYHSQSVEEALELFGMLRKMTYSLLKSVPEEAWKNTVEHSESGTMTLDQWLKIYEQHTHIGQILRTYEAWKLEHRGSGSK